MTQQAGTEAAALEALELDYGAVYLIGYHESHGYWAERRDQLGGLLEKGTPDELRAAMAEDHALKPVRLWCPHCGRRAVFAAGSPVHAATLSRTGYDGHTAHAVSAEPPLWKAAREVEADYGGAFRVTARLGILRADWAPGAAGAGEAVMHYEGRDQQDPEGDLRRQLDEAARGTRWERAAPGTPR